MRAFVFPGQGSQQIGMGKALAEAFPTAREVFEEVDDALDQALFRLMTEGDPADLDLTGNTQPALMAVSLAVARVIEKDGGRKLADLAGFAAGHSLGEYSALAATGSLTLSDTARLLRRRGQAMQLAVPVGEGAMAAILGLDLATVTALAQQAAQGEICAAANDNADGQVVISGHAAAVERAIGLARENGARRAVALSVSAPFHCALMAPAAEAMAEALAAVPVSLPAPPVIANVTVEPAGDAAAIRADLVAQVTGMVRWRETMGRLIEEGVREIVELGAGKVLAGLAKRASRDWEIRSLEQPEDIELFLKDV